jgi:L-fucose mutarotase
MLKTTLLHPEILMGLGSNGHGARVLIADANFPFSTGVPGGCQKVFLNLAADMLRVTDVLEVIRDHIVVEEAFIMMPPDEQDQPIHAIFRCLLGEAIPFRKEKRAAFYREAGSAQTCLLVATGDTRRFGNILLVIGSRRMGEVPEGSVR